jgi:hypothetical protein
VSCGYVAETGEIAVCQMLPQCEKYMEYRSASQGPLSISWIAIWARSRHRRLVVYHVIYQDFAEFFKIVSILYIYIYIYILRIEGFYIYPIELRKILLISEVV